MRKRDRPFVVYRRPSGSFMIVPRGVAGWVQFVTWLAMLVLHVLWFIDFARNTDDGDTFFYGLMIFVLGLIGWAVGGIWYMLVRGEVVDMVVWKRDRQREARKRQRRGQ